MRNSSWYISRGALAVILNGAKRSEESKAFARKTALSWDETLWILRVVYPKRSRRAQNDIQRNCRAGYAKVSESRNPEEPYTLPHLDSRSEPAPYPNTGSGMTVNGRRNETGTFKMPTAKERSLNSSLTVTPAKAGVHSPPHLDSCLRRNDDHAPGPILARPYHLGNLPREVSP